MKFPKIKITFDWSHFIIRNANFLLKKTRLEGQSIYYSTAVKMKTNRNSKSLGLKKILIGHGHCSQHLLSKIVKCILFYLFYFNKIHVVTYTLNGNDFFL